VSRIFPKLPAFQFSFFEAAAVPYAWNNALPFCFLFALLAFAILSLSFFLPFFFPLVHLCPSPFFWAAIWLCLGVVFSLSFLLAPLIVCPDSSLSFAGFRARLPRLFGWIGGYQSCARLSLCVWLCSVFGGPSPLFLPWCLCPPPSRGRASLVQR